MFKEVKKERQKTKEEEEEKKGGRIVKGMEGKEEKTKLKKAKNSGRNARMLYILGFRIISLLIYIYERQKGL